MRIPVINTRRKSFFANLFEEITENKLNETLSLLLLLFYNVKISSLSERDIQLQNL